MTSRGLLRVVAAAAVVVSASAQQQFDPDFNPTVESPAYAEGQGPVVAVDAAHNNFHTADGRYKPFADLLRRDGYAVRGFDVHFTADSLEGVEILVISNALNERNREDW